MKKQLFLSAGFVVVQLVSSVGLSEPTVPMEHNELTYSNGQPVIDDRPFRQPRVKGQTVKQPVAKSPLDKIDVSEWRDDQRELLAKIVVDLTQLNTNLTDSMSVMTVLQESPLWRDLSKYSIMPRSEEEARQILKDKITAYINSVSPFDEAQIHHPISRLVNMSEPSLMWSVFQRLRYDEIGYPNLPELTPEGTLSLIYTLVDNDVNLEYLREFSVGLDRALWVLKLCSFVREKGSQKIRTDKAICSYVREDIFGHLSTEQSKNETEIEKILTTDLYN